MNPPLRIHILQHVFFEDEANIGTWAKKNHHKVSKSLLYKNESLPKPSQFDWLVILGGPMSVNDGDKFPWLIHEIDCIKSAIDAGKTVLGICLGAQLIARSLGSIVHKNPHKEIGWHIVSLSRKEKSASFFGDFPDEFTGFHWHGETFNLPPGCLRLAESAACFNQAFIYGKSVLGLQFHLESSEVSIRRLIENCPEDLASGKFVQPDVSTLINDTKISEIKDLLNKFLQKLHERTAL